MPPRTIDYEAMAYAAMLLDVGLYYARHIDDPECSAGASMDGARTVLKGLGVDFPTIAEGREFRRAVWRVKQRVSG